MAADTANQKVFVPLAGVLKLQDEVRRLEVIISASSKEATTYARARHDGFRRAVEFLGLPIEVRVFN